MSSLSTEELKKAIQTLGETLQFAQQSVSHEIQFKIARDACIPRFEYSLKVSWKVAMKKLGSQTKFAKQAGRDLARAELIPSSDQWLEFVEARNNTSPAYIEDVAQST